MIIQGECAPQFIELKEKFKKYFEENKESGANFSIVKNGKVLVNIYGGKKNHLQNWDEDTIVNTFSLSKGIYAGCIAKLIQEKIIDIEKKVSFYWPKFKKNKENIKVKHILSHQAGLYRFKIKIKNEDLLDFNKITHILEDQDPDHPPGFETFYHAKTHGFLVENLIRKTTQLNLKDFFSQNFSKKYNLNFNFGFDNKDFKNVADLEEQNLKDIEKRDQDYNAFNNPVHDINFYNSRSWRLSGVPSMGGHGSALSIAKFYDILANDIKHDDNRVISKNNFLNILKISNFNNDGSLGIPIKWTYSGYIIRGGWLFGKNKESFGHNGWGGSVGFADPIEGVGISYVTKKINSSMSADKRVINLIKKFYEILNH